MIEDVILAFDQKKSPPAGVAVATSIAVPPVQMEVSVIETCACGYTIIVIVVE